MSSEEPKVNTHGDSQTEESLPKDIKASLPDKTETTPSTSSQNVSQAVATPAPMPQDQLNLRACSPYFICHLASSACLVRPVLQPIYILYLLCFRRINFI